MEISFKRNDLFTDEDGLKISEAGFLNVFSGGGSYFYCIFISKFFSILLVGEAPTQNPLSLFDTPPYRTSYF
jgi:hypothetical protein